MNKKVNYAHQYLSRTETIEISDEFITCIAKNLYASCTKKELSDLEKYRKPIISALSYIEDNLSRKITLADICDITGLKTSGISQLFRDIIGFTFVDYVNFIRCHRARLLLTNSTIPINKIAAVCGFSSTTYFDRVFRNFNEETPKVYRDRTAIEWREGTLPTSSRQYNK